MEAGPGPRRHLEMGDTGGPSETSGGRGSGNDIFTKILDRQPFEKHRKTVLNAAANDGIPSARDKKAMGAWPRRF